MREYWELRLFLGLAIVTFVWMVLLIVKAWWDDRRKWKQVQRYYGCPYDASVRTEPRPNIRLVRP